MKTLTKTKEKSFYIDIIAIILIFGLSSCATQTKFLPSTIVPAAEGVIKIKQDKNKNYQINIQMVNLADSKLLASAKENYVVWMVSDKETKNLGQIKSSSGTLSKALKASFETVTPTKPDKIFITTEDDPAVEYPSSEIVLTSENL